MEPCLEQALTDRLERLKRNSIQITYRNPGDPIGAGQSKIGGKPDLPSTFDWPYYEGEPCFGTRENRPLSFLAQIDLAEASAFDLEHLLPRTGVLSFFYELETQEWGFDPRHKGCARVFYFAEDTVLKETDFPQDLEQDYRIPELAVSFEQAYNVPTSTDFDETEESRELDARFPSFRNASGWWDDYEKLREKYGGPLYGDGSRDMKLLGYPDTIQAAMGADCEQAAREIGVDRTPLLSLEERYDIQRAGREWTLLFQMGTIGTENFELMFGDAGRIYFWIRKKDLAAGNFDRVWLILQCG